VYSRVLLSHGGSFTEEKHMKLRLPTCLLRILLSAVVAALPVAGASAQTLELHPSRAPVRSQPIPGRYIVVFKDDVADPAAAASDAALRAGGQRHHTFTHALKGFSATLSDAGVERLRHEPSVDYIEQDQTVSVANVESPATWGLDRIDQADRPLDTLYHFNYTGQGVYAFIIDTGIRADHSEFTGRVRPGFTSIVDGNGTNDCDGHGTHVAGTVGGATWGVAKQVSLTPVRVLDCTGSGTISGVIAGVDWVANSTTRPAVANMSLGGGLSSALNAAVAGAVAKGVTMVVAAGNENTDACRSSPASEPSAIAVGASTSADARASFSNFGTCVEIFAPGTSITSAWNTSSSATAVLNGTSMATPHVTGAAALALEANPAASPAAVATFLTANATANRLSSVGTGSPNRLLYTLAGGSPTEAPKPVIAVKSLSGKALKAGRNWRAQATAAIRNIDTNAAVANATVRAIFSPGGTVSCVTASNGSCTLTSAVISTTNSATVMTVDGVSGTNMIYDSSQNLASQIIINKR
jgi:subtilisin family serine protease